MFPDKHAAMMAQLKAAIETQQKGVEITNEKIKAMQHRYRARKQLYEALTDAARIKGEKAVADAYIAMGRAYAVIDTSDKEQAELMQSVAVMNLELMRQQLEMMENPSPLVGVQLNHVGRA